MKKILILLFLSTSLYSQGQVPEGLHQRDLHKDVLLKTSKGTMVIRLSDSTPLHRDNFLLMVKQHYYDGMLFHRVIRNFMIQTGDYRSRNAAAGMALGDSGANHTIPKEIIPTFYHHKGVVAAARWGDDVNPERKSSGSHFYIVQGRIHTDQSLDSVEKFRLKGNKIPADRREMYKTVGGSPHLDQQYTIFGQVVQGLSVIDSIAVVPTSKGVDKDRPLEDIRILKMRLIRRKDYAVEDPRIPYGM